MCFTYEELPLIDFSAPKVINNRKRENKEMAPQDYAQNKADAKSVLSCANLANGQYLENIIEVAEKYMIETQPHDPQNTKKSIRANLNRSDKVRLPHYTHLMKLNNRLVFQAACCLPLRVLAANLDGKSVYGKTLFKSHSNSGGGKLVYEFLGMGNELIIDLKRGDSSKAQRLTFLILK
ncbi:MAG: hypothetical protein E3K37_11415 [Candidatus Kuenenia sp.]|nr:hypothetical protein [Candidatus Kuenenia hertensis]